jgi:hypothetical protein
MMQLGIVKGGNMNENVKEWLDTLGHAVDNLALLTVAVQDQVLEYRREIDTMEFQNLGHTNKYSLPEKLIQRKETEFKYAWLQKRMSDLNALLRELKNEIRPYLHNGLSYDVSNYTLYIDKCTGCVEIIQHQ